MFDVGEDDDESGEEHHPPSLPARSPWEKEEAMGEEWEGVRRQLGEEKEEAMAMSKMGK